MGWTPMDCQVLMIVAFDTMSQACWIHVAMSCPLALVYPLADVPPSVHCECPCPLVATLECNLPEWNPLQSQDSSEQWCCCCVNGWRTYPEVGRFSCDDQLHKEPRCIAPRFGRLGHPSIPLAVQCRWCCCVEKLPRESLGQYGHLGHLSRWLTWGTWSQIQCTPTWLYICQNDPKYEWILTFHQPNLGSILERGQNQC